MLRTITPDKLMDFLFYVYDEADKEKLYNVWLHKEMDKTPEDLYKEFFNPRRKKNKKAIESDKEQAKRNIEIANRFVKVRKEK